MNQLRHTGYIKNDQEKMSKRYTIANGFLSYLGCMDEVSLGIKGEFIGEKNPHFFPDPLYTTLSIYDKVITPDKFNPFKHEQDLDLQSGVLRRKTSYQLPTTIIEVESIRFVDQEDPHFIYSSFSFSSTNPCILDVHSGIDIFPFELGEDSLRFGDESILSIYQPKDPYYIEKMVDTSFKDKPATVVTDGFNFHYHLKVEAGKLYTVNQYVYVGQEKMKHTGLNTKKSEGFKSLLRQNKKWWKIKLDKASVNTLGKDHFDTLSKSVVYNLIAFRPRIGGHLPITSQFYALPYYLNVFEDEAHIIIKQIISDLEDAKASAILENLTGANYALSTSEATLSIFQNGLVSLMLQEYYERTTNREIFVNGALDVLYEIGLYYAEKSTYHVESNTSTFDNIRFPDPNHPIVNNEAFSNNLAKDAIDFLFTMISELSKEYKKEITSFKKKHESELKRIKLLKQTLEVPTPNRKLLIELFDGYFALKDPITKVLRLKMTKKGEVAEKPIVHQEDQYIRFPSVLFLLIFKRSFNNFVLKANYDFYKARTKSNSFFAQFAIAMIGAKVGDTTPGEIFLKDVTCVEEFESYHHLHENNLTMSGAIYSLLVYGFSDFKINYPFVYADYSLPRGMNGILFNARVNGRFAHIKVKNTQVEVQWEEHNEI